MPKEERDKKDNSLTIAIIGLIGTIIAAALGSPLLISLIERNQATATSPAVATTEVPVGVTSEPTVGNNQILIFREDFDSDNISGFAFEHGQWRVGKDRSNQVLEGNADTPGAAATFGPSDFSNGIIEFFIRVDQFTSEAAINFRSSDRAAYSLTFMQNHVSLGFRDTDNGKTFEPFSNNTSRSLVFDQGIWYLIRIEARGSQIVVFIDNNRIFSASDTRLKVGGLSLFLDPGYQAAFDDVKVWELR